MSEKSPNDEFDITLTREEIGVLALGCSALAFQLDNSETSHKLCDILENVITKFKVIQKKELENE